MSDFDDQLTQLDDLYPRPTAEVTGRARAEVLSARPSGRRDVPLRRPGRRLVLAAIAVAAAVAAAFAAGLAVASSPERTITAPTAATGPGFLPATGWNVLQTGLTVPPEGPVASAANVPFAPADLSQQSPPTATVAALPASGVLLWAQFYPSGQIPAIDRTFPVRTLPLRLADARVTTNPEGFGGSGAVRRIAARVNGYNVDVVIFFGANQPSASALADARGELARLTLPACPAIAQPIDPYEVAAAQAYLVAWLRAHYVSRLSDLRGARARAVVVSGVRDRRIRLVATTCASQAAHLVAVTVTPSAAGRANLGRLPLLYFLSKTSTGWSVWREG
jgi:hypothetical protein